jgi:DtxR family transcriptional regulator, Mn-dependent transcriptional regulator
MITVSKEDYLKAIFEAESEGEVVISATLAHWLKVSRTRGHHGFTPVKA